MLQVEITHGRKRPWRGYIGRPGLFDVIGGTQFSLLCLFLGLRETHKVLEIGCGCLRAGKFLISYLDEGNYCGIEPREEVLNWGLEHELGHEMQRLKAPRFTARTDFGFHEFETTFDFALAYSVLPHTPPRDIPIIFDNLSKCFHDDSVLLASAVFRDEERIIDYENWTGRPTNHYSFSRIEGAANDAGMRVLSVGHAYQGWFVAFIDGNQKAEAAANQMSKIDFKSLLSKWEVPQKALY